MKVFRFSGCRWLVAGVLCVLAACGGGETFKLEVTVDGLGTQNVNLYYYTRSGLKSVSIPAVDGKLVYTGSSKEPVLIELTAGGRRSLGFVVAQNGQTVKASYRIGDAGATTVSGNKVAKRLAEFCADNAAYIDSLQPEALNGAIERYVAANPRDEVSAILMSRYYDATLDPARAAELLRGIDPAARTAAIVAGMGEMLNVMPDSAMTRMEAVRLLCGKDSMVTVAPHDSLGVILAILRPDMNADRDSVVEYYNAAYDTLKTRVTLAVMMTAADTAAWRARIDSVAPRYVYGWLPGGVASPEVRDLNVKSLPAVIAADSTGCIVYRGASLEEAALTVAK